VSGADNAWVLPNGELSARARHVLAEPSRSNLEQRDCFGNTPLHLFAALEGYQEPLFGMVLNSPDLHATNNSGQTFLHLLCLDWFADSLGPSALLRQLLAYVRGQWPRLVYMRDVYGRTFFHRAHSIIRDSEVLDSILSPFDPAISSRRDAFNFNPFANNSLGGEGPFMPPRRAGTQTCRSDEEPASLGRRHSGSSSEEDSFLAYHARLVQIIHRSYCNPRVEDASGKNGLHCLAEAILNQESMDERRSALNTGRPLKRKHDKKDAPEGAEGPLARRLRHIEGLLAGTTQPVDVNHYDKEGNTVLMAFITHIPDDQDDKGKMLSHVLEALIRCGAKLEARNRRGETALLLAARLGRKIALGTLLQHGANVHARDVDGHGVLKMLDERCRAAKDDLALYARLEACRAILTGRPDWGVTQNPSVLQEWCSKVPG
jgi:ankyrin repeat protein